MKYDVEIGTGDWFGHSEVSKGDMQTYRYTDSIVIS
jgi:hypothetical protein